MHLNTAVDEVLGESRVEGLRLLDTTTNETREVPMEGLFVAIGYQPNTGVFRDWLDVDDKGYLEVHDETGSKIDGVFIAGDVHDHRYRQAVTAAGDGCKAAIDAERWLEAQGVHEVSTATAW
jgi:thioredoxin reductase (NADPH)